MVVLKLKFVRNPMEILTRKYGDKPIGSRGSQVGNPFLFLFSSASHPLSFPPFSCSWLVRHTLSLLPNSSGFVSPEFSSFFSGWAALPNPFSSSFLSTSHAPTHTLISFYLFILFHFLFLFFFPFHPSHPF